MKLNTYLTSIKSFLAENKFDLVLILLIFTLSFTFRSIRINEHLFFGFEQGRDAFIARDIASLKDFQLVGPKTDIGGIFHGAWYYYLISIPYGLFAGNPLAASFFLILLGSIVPVLFYWLFRKMDFDYPWSLFAGLLVAVSSQLIDYSRWLSNVSPAVIFTTIAFIFLWQFYQTKKQYYYVLWGATYLLAAQFEIILCLFFPFLVILTLISEVFKPKIKTIILTMIVGSLWFLPMILFNLRNQFISLLAVKQLITDPNHQSGFKLSSFLTFISKELENFSRSLVNIHPAVSLILILVLAVGLVVMVNTKKYRASVLLFLFWLTSTLPLLLFSSFSSLPQLYVGTQVAIIGLAVLGLYGWKIINPVIGKVILGLFICLVIFQATQTVERLKNNRGAFFITIQDDLNLKDQYSLLEHIKNESQGNPYRLKAFTIPYYQEAGWQYLSQLIEPNRSEFGAEIIYLIVEQKVDPYWEQRWLEDLDPTVLEDEKDFGLIRLLKLRID